MADRPQSFFTPISEDASLDTINAMIYGHPGIGKTALLATGGKTMAIMDSDSKGTITAKALGSEALKREVIDYTELARAYDYIANSKTHGFTDVAWDSLTLFQDRALVDDILQDAAAQNPRQSSDVASQREYLISQNRIGTYVRLFADLPINFWVTAHVMVGEDTEGDGGLIYKPAISGKKGSYSSYICGYMNVIGYYGRTPGGTRRLLTERVDQFFAKDRFHALRTNGKGYIDNPTIPMITKLVREKMAGNSPSAPRSNVTPIKKAAAVKKAAAKRS